MIAYLQGKLTQLQEESIIIDINGIGYEVFCANPFVFQDALNQDVKVYTYHHFREDQQSLYGFKTEDEKYLFTKLLTVSGIGPKSAMAVMANANVAEFVTAVEQENEKYLTSFPGIGKKTARQIILDLKGKLTDVVMIKAETPVESPANQEDKQALREAEEALKALGYLDREIRAIMPQLQKETDATTDALIRKALALLMKN